MTALAAWWRNQGRPARIIVGIVLAVAAFNAFLGAVRTLTGGREPGGPSSSSFATAPSGMAAWAGLLEGAGHPIRRLRDDPRDAGLDPGITLVVADPGDVDEADRAAIARFVRGGGRLVATGRGAAALLTSVAGGRVRWAPDGDPRSVVGAPVAEVAGVSVVGGTGQGRWSDAGPLLPVLLGDGQPQALVGGVGAGRIVGLADPTILHNRALAGDDNALFALQIAGPQGRPVAFAESYHGYGRSVGLAGLPGRWKLALAIAGLAGLAFLWARGRRLGPAEELARALPPARREYVDAMAALLLRSRDPVGAAEPVRVAVRQALARRLAPASAGDEAGLRAAAVQAGLTPDEIDAVFRRTGDEPAVLACGRALARLEGSTGGQGTA